MAVARQHGNDWKQVDPNNRLKAAGVTADQVFSAASAYYSLPAWAPAKNKRLGGGKGHPKARVAAIEQQLSVEHLTEKKREELQGKLEEEKAKLAALVAEEEKNKKAGKSGMKGGGGQGFLDMSKFTELTSSSERVRV